MNWSMVAAVAAVVGVLATIVGAAIVYGSVIQETRQNTTSILDLRTECGERLDGHDTKIGELEVKAAATLAFQKGFEAGRARTHST